MNRIFLIILLFTYLPAWSQSDRVKTVETPDSASMVIFDTSGTNILGTDVQEAIEESNPVYNNHVWISETGGDNATGRLGDPHRAFASPWVAQDSVAPENVSVLAYQGGYSSTFASGGPLNEKDTFMLFGFPGANFSMTGVSAGGQFILSDISGGATSKKYVYVDAPESAFTVSGSGASFQGAIGMYNRYSELYFNARKLTFATGRNFGIQAGAKKAIINVDTIHVGGGIAFSLYNEYTPVSTYTFSRNVQANIGNVISGTANTTDNSGVFRMQVNAGASTDSLSNVVINAGNVRANNAGLFFINISNGNRLVNSNVSFSAKKYMNTSQLGTTIGIFNFTSDNTTEGEIIGSSIAAALESGTVNGAIYNQSNTDILRLVGSSVNINLGVIRSTRTTGNIIDLENIILEDSSVFRIHCDYCEFEPGAVPIRIINCDIPAGSRLELSGVYVSRARNGEMVRIEANTDLSGVTFKDAVFINNGTSEWIEATVPVTLSGISGAWSNSTTTINVNVAGNELWGFSDCAGTFRPLQEILDAGCDTASSAELTIFFTDTPPDTIELTTSYTVVEWQASGADGPAIALSATGDSLLLDEGVYEIHYNIQAVFFAATTDYYIQPAIRQGAGVLNKSIRTAYNIWGADEEKATHIACTFRTEISADNTPIALVLAGDDNAAGGADVLIEKAILYVEKIE